MHVRSLVVVSIFISTLWGTGNSVPTQSRLSDDVFFVSTFGIEAVGCDSISVVDVTQSNPLHLSKRQQQTNPIGRIAVTKDRNLALAVHASNESAESFLSMLFFDDSAQSGWSSSRLYGANFALAGGIEILGDDETLLVATVGDMPRELRGTSHEPPYEVAKFYLSEIEPRDDGYYHLGPKRGLATSASPIAEILGTNGTQVHFVTEEMAVHTIDAASMMPSAAPIEMASFAFQPSQFDPHWIGAVYADISNDGRYLISNRWATDTGTTALNIADLQMRTSSTLDIDAPIDILSILKFSRASSDRNMLALNTKSQVLIATLKDGPRLQVEQVLEIGPNLTGPGGYGLSEDALDWSENGMDLLVSSSIPDDSGLPKTGVLRHFTMTDSSPDQNLTFEKDIEVCSSQEHTSSIMAVQSGNASTLPPEVRIEALPTSTLPPTPTQTLGLPPTLMPQPSLTTTDTPSPSITTTPSSSETLTPTESSTSTPSRAAQATVEHIPVFLPLLLSETCPPIDWFLDVVLVIDSSSSMEAVENGQSKLERSVDAANVFLDQLRVEEGADRASVIVFNQSATVLEPLTSNLAELKRSLSNVAIREGSRLDLAAQTAAIELAKNPRRNSVSAIIFLTDGQIDDDVSILALESLQDMKFNGTTIVLIDLSDQANQRPLVRHIPSDPKFYYPLASAAQLSQVYSELSVKLPCDSDVYWGRR